MGLNLSGMTTETRNPRTMQLDQMSPLEIVTVMNEEDARVPLAIAKCLPQIAQAVTWAAEAFEKGGRLFYMGAGTSGRLGVLDAAECPPTFGVPKEMVVGLIAGGEKAFIEAVEGSEDSRELAVEDLKAHGLTANDLWWALPLPAARPMCWAVWTTPRAWAATLPPLPAISAAPSARPQSLPLR